MLADLALIFSIIAASYCNAFDAISSNMASREGILMFCS